MGIACPHRKYSAIMPVVCLCLILILTTAVQAALFFPWENENSVRALLTQQPRDGQSVVCEARVDRIAARSNPPFFILRDEFRLTSDPDSRIVVLCRAPLTLRRGQAVRVQGILGHLPNSEPCILDPTVEGYFDQVTGAPLRWTPALDFAISANRQVLPAPTGPIPPSDPSLADDGTGIAGEVSAYGTEGAARFDTVASLIATAPPALTRIALACKPVVSVGDGFIVVGDDSDSTSVKVYTNAAVKPTDRVMALSGTAHSENGGLVIYAGAGPSPFYDFQGEGGGVTVAGIGSVAYAATLSDPSAATSSGGVGTMSISPPSEDDGGWVYLTGQVVTYVGQYYSYAIPNGGWINVYDIQGVDRTPGMRVWYPAHDYYYYGPNYVGAVVDVMAQVDTKDGQRILGIWSDDQWNAIDLTSLTHCIEAKILAVGDYYNPLNVVPVGIINRDLGGATLGHNPGVTGGQGLYNIGSYVTVWGKVLESGPRWDANWNQVAWPYQFDQNANYTTPYMRIDDGSAVPSGNSYSASYGDPYGTQGITVFGTNTYDGYNQVNVDDYVSVTGVSSVWKPNGSTNTFRSVWTSGCAQNQGTPPQQSTREVTATGTISGTVKLYDMPSSTATVQVYSTCGKSASLTINRGADNSGSATFSWTGIPKTVLVDGYWEEYPEYIVSAKCDDYKTRTYTGITPWTGTAAPRNLYLIRLRKIYVMTDNTWIDSDPGGTNSTVITATLRDADHNLVTTSLTIRFRTNKGSFSSSSIEHTATRTTTSGTATATVYGVPSEWGYNDVVVEATDDSAPLTGDDPDDDPYKYDWQQLHDQYGQADYYNITIYPPTVELELTPDPVVGTIYENQKTVTAMLTMCGSGTTGIVEFNTTNGTFLESETSTAEVTANSSGKATVTLVRPESYIFSEGDVSATGTVFPGTPEAFPVYANTVHATWQSWKVKVTVNPDLVISGTSVNVKAKLTLQDGTTPVAGQSVVLTTDYGTFNPHDSGYPQRYTANTSSSGEISTTLTVNDYPVTATVTSTTTTSGGGRTFTDSDDLEVVSPGTQLIDLVFAIDMTGSMGQAQAQARQNIGELVDDLVVAGKKFRLGGVKFDDAIYDTKLLTGDVSDYKSWLNEDYPPERDGGLDTNENQLGALKKASEIAPAGYIGLATDAGFHYCGDNDDPDSYNHSGADCPYTSLTAPQTRNLLIAANCEVYIDADAKWDSEDPSRLSWQHYTTPDVILHVNGEMESASYGTYTFPKLKAAILGP